MSATLVATLDSNVSAAPGWQSVEPMPTPRAYHAAATIGNAWYVAGGAAPYGAGGETFPTDIDVYDPSTGHWTVIGQLSQGREYIVAIPDVTHSRVLFVGGSIVGGPLFLFLTASDLAMGSSASATTSLVRARSQHAGAFAAGAFIVSGGWGGGETEGRHLDDAEVLEGPASCWQLAGTMPAGARSSHTMTTLRNGTDVLVVGGGLPDRAMTQVDLFDASQRKWSTVASLNVARARHTAKLLADGRVLVAGALSYPPITVESSAEIYDPTTNRWTMAAPMHDGRYDHDMVLLPDGRVFVAGGTNDPGNGELGALASAEVYDPLADSWTMLPPMQDRRRWPTLAVLSDGVYVAGGDNASGTLSTDVTILASVERLSWSDLGITNVTIPPGGRVDGSADDASSDSAPPSCGGGDAGGQDAAADAGSTDGSQDGSTRDAASGGGAGNGCSCEAQPGGIRSDSEMTLLLIMLWAFQILRRACRRQGGSGDGDLGEGSECPSGGLARDHEPDRRLVRVV